MRFMNAAETVTQLRKWGVPAKYYPGYATRTRPGAHSDARGILVHHTGSQSQSDDYLGFLFVRGRAEEGIPGPLCNVATDTDGDLWVGAVGRANHAGKGSGTTLTKVSDGDAPLAGEISPGADTIDGNAHYYGNEVRYDGARPMTAAQRRTSLLWAAAVCDWHGWDAGHVAGHREHTRRKNDPGNNPMDQYRRDLQAVLNAGPPGTKPPLEELTMSDIKVITDRLDRMEKTLNAHVTSENGRYNQYMPTLQEIDAEGDQGRAATAQALAVLQGQLAQVTGIVAALAEKLEPKA